MALYVDDQAVKRTQDNVRARRSRVAYGMFHCSTPASKEEARAFADLDDRVHKYLAEEPSWLAAASQVEAGEALERELDAWDQRLRARGCPMPAVQMPGPPASLASMFESLAPLATLGLLWMLARSLRGR